MSTRREELERQLRRKRLEERLRQKRAAEAQQAAPEPESPSLRDRATALTQGATWAWGDELTSAAAALPAWMMDDSDKSYGEIYRDIHQSENDRFRQYAKENPKEAMALEVAGGFLTRRPKIKPRLDKVLGRTQKVAAKQAQKQAEMTAARRIRGNLLRNTGGGILEGAAAGAGSRDIGDRTGGAMIGGAIGGALPLTLSGGREIGRGLTSRKVATELGRGDDFSSLSLAADPGESATVDYFRNWLGKAPGPMHIIRNMENKTFAKEAARTKGLKSMDEKMADRLKGRREFASNYKTQLGQKRSDALNEIDDRVTARQQVIDDAKDARIGKIEADEMAGRSQVQRVAPELAEQSSDEFRRLTSANVLPDSAPQELRQALPDMHPQKAAKAADSWWQENGFQAQKNMKFDVGELRKTLGKKFMKGSDGQVSGKSIFDMRNDIARTANKMVDSNPFKAGKLRQKVSDIDDAMRAQMDDDLTTAFDDEIAQWSVKQNFVGAVDRAVNKKQGRFNEDDWIATGWGRKKRYGEAPFQEEAAKRQLRQEKVTKAAKKTDEKLAQKAQKARTQARKQASRLKKTMSQRKKEAKRELGKKIESDEGMAKAKRQVRSSERGKTRLARSAAKQSAREAQLKKRGIAENPSIYQQALMFTLSNVVPGAGFALSAPSGQRFLAGQTRWQNRARQMAEGLRDANIKGQRLGGGADRLRSSAIRNITSKDDRR